MDIYNYLLNEYKNYLKRDKVESNDEIFSAYDLWILLCKRIREYQYIKNDNSGLVSEVNAKYKLAFNSILHSDLYDSAVENFDTKIPVFRPIKFIGIETNYINDYKTVAFNFILRSKVTDNKERVNEKITVYRDFGDDRYYGDHTNRFLIYCCKDLLDERVNILERYAPFVKMLENGDSPSNQIIENDVLSININHSLVGSPSLNIKLNKTIDPNDSQYKNYSDVPYTIISLIQGKEEELLKRTPIKIEKLNKACKCLVETYLKEKYMLKIKLKKLEKNREKYAKKENENN